MDEAMRLLEQARLHLRMAMAITAYREVQRGLRALDAVIPGARDDEFMAAMNVAAELQLVGFDAARHLVRRCAGEKRREIRAAGRGGRP